MARKNQRIQVLQDSPFLNLPAEIREQIYYISLVRDSSIDLWPGKYTEKSPTGEVYRLQEDLEFIRKEMGTGLFTTCKQIYYEASNIFWSRNTFRFSDDIYWFGARRFLAQIGPRAISQLQSLELFVPVMDAVWGDPSHGDGDWMLNAALAKNKPKMHMAKARAKPWTRTRDPKHYQHGGHPRPENSKRFGFAWPRTALQTNVDHVCYLLGMAKVSLELRLILPTRFGIDLPASRIQAWRYEEER